MALGREWFKKLRHYISVVCVTKRGPHLYFKGGSVGNSIGEIDIRSSSGGYVVAPGSVVDGHTYYCPKGFDNVSKLQPFSSDWLPKKKTNGEPIEFEGDMCYRAWRYIAAIPGAKQGHRDNACFAVACRLIRDFRLTSQEALPILYSFADRCEPPVKNTKQLRRKITEAQKGI